MADVIHLDILTPEKTVFSDSIEAVTAPGTLGEFGVLPGHAALVTTLEIGEVVIKKDNREYWVAISGGFAEVGNDKVTILAEAAEPAQEIDIKRAEAAKIQAEEKLKNLSSDKSEFSEQVFALKRATNRIKVSARKP
ncbi:MAG: F0F1 ATP synthase subunit epsilon [Thermodesulfobacteriota bacterium]|jgi:F-type H+-transporting ATPase subunit epsilon|nr:MAG: F0F1 ATP synthase subunit epsilon [Thermodesulfobacteriota bacterium]